MCHWDGHLDDSIPGRIIIRDMSLLAIRNFCRRLMMRRAHMLDDLILNAPL